MQSEKAILETISDKEHNLKESSILAEIHANEIISQARAKANLIISNAEREGREVAESLYQKELALLDQESAKIRQEGEQKAEEMRASGKARIPEVVAKVVEFITR